MKEISIKKLDKIMKNKKVIYGTQGLKRFLKTIIKREGIKK